MKKALRFPTCGHPKLSQNERSLSLRERLAAAAFATTLRSSSSRISRVVIAAFATCSGARTIDPSSAGSGGLRREREATRCAVAAGLGSLRRGWAHSKAQMNPACGRAATAVSCRATHSARLQPRPLHPLHHDRRHPRRRPNSLQLPGDRLRRVVGRPAPRPSAFSSSCTGSTGRADASVAVMSVWPSPSTRSASTRRRPGSRLRENVVEQEQRRESPPFGDQRGLGEQKREHGEALLALASRSSADRGSAPSRRCRRGVAAARRSRSRSRSSRASSDSTVGGSPS